MSETNETEEQAEERIQQEDAVSNLRLLDYIADKIGLPQDEELSRENFNAWFHSRAMVQEQTDIVLRLLQSAEEDASE